MIQKYILSLFVAFLALTGCSIYSAQAQKNAANDTIRICTYNIRRLGSEKDEKNKWQNRKGLVFGTVDEINPDVIGFQEVVKEQLADLREAMPDYDSFGKPRSAKVKSWWQKFVLRHPSAKDEHNPLFYNTNTTTLIKKGNFGINPRGYIMHAHLPRICTWGLFEDIETGKKFYVYNTHLDNQSGLIRRRQINKILKHVKKDTGQEMVIIMGDFNSRLSGKNKSRMLSKAGFENTKNSAQKCVGPKETRTGWENNPELKIIDHIFVKPETVVIKKHDVVASPEGVFPSDHRPVYVDIVK